MFNEICEKLIKTASIKRKEKEDVRIGRNEGEKKKGCCK